MEDRVWEVLEKLNSPEKFETNFAILILNRPILCDPELIKLLWNKASFRTLVDGGANQWLTFLQENGAVNFENPNVICGDFDSLKLRGRAYFEKRGVQFLSTPDQNETDFLKALRILAAQASERVNFVFAICENSGRLDQIFANINTLLRAHEFMSHIDIYLLTRESISWVIRPGVNVIIATQECVKEEYICGLIPANEPVKVTTSGLKWNLDHHILNMDALISTSNVYMDSEVRIICAGNLLWTTQYRNGKH